MIICRRVDRRCPTMSPGIIWWGWPVHKNDNLTSTDRTGERARWTQTAAPNAHTFHVFFRSPRRVYFFFFLLLFSQQFTRVAHPTAPIISEPVRRTHADRFFGPRPTSAVLWTCYSAKYVIMVQTVGYSQYFCRVLRIRWRTGSVQAPSWLACF